jgi:MFS family permease
MTVLALPEIEALRVLAPDGRRLLGTRMLRLFAYGFLSVVLVLYLAELGFEERRIGLLLTLTLAGDAVISLAIAAIADRVGRRRMLIAGAALMILAGLAFLLTRSYALLTLAAIVGTISPSGAEVGPFLAIEQAALTQTVPDQHRTQVFAWYNLAGSCATALGALCGGALAQALQHGGLSPLASYRAVVAGYALFGALLVVMFSRLSPAAEAELSIANDKLRKHSCAKTNAQFSILNSQFGLRRSRRVVLKLASLFMLDALAGGLVVQSLIAYWFARRYGVEPALLGAIFFGANMLAGISALAAARIAARFGLINTMVWTHLPSNVLLILIPLMPNLALAIIVLLVRFSISQMDVPTRQSYTMAVVDPDERSAAAGVTTIARTVAVAIAPTITGALLSMSLLSLPFALAGGLKIAYDLLLYRSFRALKPPEEHAK